MLIGAHVFPPGGVLIILLLAGEGQIHRSEDPRWSLKFSTLTRIGISPLLTIGSYFCLDIVLLQHLVLLCVPFFTNSARCLPLKKSAGKKPNVLRAADWLSNTLAQLAKNASAHPSKMRRTDLSSISSVSTRILPSLVY